MFKGGLHARGPMKRKALAVGAAAALLVALYAAAGYWLAPRYVREALAELAASRGLTLDLATVRTRPFELRVELEDVALRGAQGRAFAEARSASADLAWASLWRRGWIFERVRVLAAQVDLGMLPAFAEAREEAGAAAVTVRRLSIEDGMLRYAPRDLVVEAVTLRASDLSTLDAAPGSYEAAGRIAGAAGELSSHGTVALAPLAADGTLSVAALRTGQLLPEAQGQLMGSARYVYRSGELTLRDVSIAGNGLAYAGIELPEATLVAEGISLPPRSPVKVTAQARVAPQGTIAAQGQVQLAPLHLDLNLDAKRLPLARAQRWLPEGVALRIASGAVSGSGKLQVGSGTSEYLGSVAVSELRLEEADSGALLLAWQGAETDKLRVALSPLRVEAGELVARAPEGRLVIEQDGSVNFAAAFPAGEREGEPLRVSVERLRVEQGTLHFADRSLANPFEVTIRELSGTVTGFTTAAGEPARVRLDGRVQPYGVARIRGTIDLDSPTQLADIRANFRNLRLQTFNPYIAKFAGYHIESGRLSAELRYAVRDGELRGSNQLVFEEMQLGEKLERRGLVDVPLDLLVALLADPNGRIVLAIPVSGNLNDPKFDFGAIIAEALGNVVQRIVSAPFRALAAIFGGNKADDPSRVAFAPGSAELSPPAEENVARLAQALEQRPRLGVDVHGAYDPARDVEALRMRAARQEVARAAGVEGSLELSDPKALRAAEQLYLARGGDGAALEALRKSEARYGRTLLQQLAETVNIDPTAAQDLARQRAEAVRGALIQHGVDPARVGIGDAVEKQAAEEGVPTELALAAGFSSDAAAGESQPAPAPRVAGDPVREAQRRLNAAGYEAGHVDGVIGPRTKRALIHYQAVQELELTGKLDAATRERLLGK
jgi:hypothetical protein